MNMKIATRKSNLAQVQTEIIMELIYKRSNIKSEKLLIETKGDKNLDVSLDKIGGKGVFVKDIEIALLEGRADAAVHSMKDVPFALEPCFEIAAIPEREDVRDAYISRNRESFFSGNKTLKIGTSSIRRAAQLRILNPNLDIVPIRGNVQTRLKKMEDEKLDGIILAAAGLKRLDMENIITDYFDPFEFVPAIGQGALGIEILKESQSANIFRNLNFDDDKICVDAEREFMKTLNGNCHSCIGAYAHLEGQIMYIVGLYDVGRRIVKKDIVGNKEDYLKLGRYLGEKIIKA
ncbi:hydroxymethylbilane synthase [Clostridium algidicarnis]|uniref:hydroxymethylbilane synthase n=1 Tax=Clostridium algidicarnis TaxID=37659 RepID=UPI001C0B8BAA|nr:hydroxymethylbilane synthase [Clostridium algidicarnis]MBU3203491.1 hydroxymethylbilane synthase [Clostridium algidicarnis]MBU3211645.1 hydroxymethylbilane synthase [Clostridium algidicarnis]MBU3221847.1 hydroxymethylbilane synthase [Clostridium algidicarnis]